MSEANTQTVVDETQAGAVPPAQVEGARNDGPDLDTLLAEFQTQTTKVEPEPTPPANQQQPNIEQGRLSAIENRLFQEDLNNAVKNIVGDLKVPTKFAKGWIDQMAREDMRIASAFTNRLTNPDAWAKVEKGLAREFAKEMKDFTSIDTQATEDRAVVAAAVRGASTNRVPDTPPPNYSHMRNGEFRKDVIEKYGFDPGV
jgi:hypothetical protein